MLKQGRPFRVIGSGLASSGIKLGEPRRAGTRSSLMSALGSNSRAKMGDGVGGIASRDIPNRHHPFHSMKIEE